MISAKTHLTYTQLYRIKSIENVKLPEQNRPRFVSYRFLRFSRSRLTINAIQPIYFWKDLEKIFRLKYGLL